MGIALDGFGWSVEHFWAATPHEFFAMVDARVEANKRIERMSRGG